MKDSDSKARFWRRANLGGFVGYSGSVVYVFFKVSQVLGLLMLPVAARWASRFLVTAAIDDAPRWIRTWMYKDWNGIYYEFDGRQLRIDDFGRDVRTMPLIAVQDLENLFRDRARFRIKLPLVPAEGLLRGIAAVPADRAAAWARSIARTSNPQAERAAKLARWIERSFIEPREKEKRLDGVKAFEARE